MKRITRTALVLATTIGLAFSLAACDAPQQTSQAKQVYKKASKARAYIPQNDVELSNYNRAQELYDQPASIIYCTAFPSNASAPIVTVPIAGKLTSSSTTFFAPEYRSSNSSGSAVTLPNRSVDGLYHPNPPQYRYGFTPGGQYVDFANVETICTTALTKFQREQTKLSITVDQSAKSATAKAEAALKAGKNEEAQRILDALEG